MGSRNRILGPGVCVFTPHLGTYGFTAGMTPRFSRLGPYTGAYFLGRPRPRFWPSSCAPARIIPRPPAQKDKAHLHPRDPSVRLAALALIRCFLALHAFFIA